MIGTVITFTTTFWKPIALIVGIAALWFGVMALKHSYDEGKRDEGRAEVRAELDAYKAAAMERTSAITLAWDQQRQATEAAAKGLDDERSKRLADSRDRVRTLPPTVAAVVVPPRAASLLNDAIAASNQPAAAGPAFAPVESRPAAAASTDDRQSDASTVGQVTAWAVEVIALYSACRDQVAGWIAFYAGLRAAQQEQSP